MAKTLPSNAGGAGLVPGQRVKIPLARKKEKRSYIVINSIKGFKKRSTSKKPFEKNLWMIFTTCSE